MEPFDPKSFQKLLADWPGVAIEFLNRYYFKRLVHRSYSRTGNRRASEDIAQEIISYVWEHRARLSALENFEIEPYLYMLARRKSISWYRKTNGVIFEPLSFDPEDVESAESELIRREEAIELWRTLRILTTRERECMLLRFMEEWPYKRIAEALGISIKAVERNLTSGKKRLQKYVLVRSNL